MQKCQEFLHFLENRLGVYYQMDGFGLGPRNKGGTKIEIYFNKGVLLIY